MEKQIISPQFGYKKDQSVVQRSTGLLFWKQVLSSYQFQKVYNETNVKCIECAEKVSLRENRAYYIYCSQSSHLVKIGSYELLIFARKYNLIKTKTWQGFIFIEQFDNRFLEEYPTYVQLILKSSNETKASVLCSELLYPPSCFNMQTILKKSVYFPERKGKP